MKVRAVHLFLFLSTPSARRATHPPVGGGDVEGISIHALREEGDIQARLFAAHDDISIHALREEGDDNDVDKFIASFDFYPRPPRGGRP